ncbi:molybdate ABC transporter substrate-binding protein [Pollutimonas bauzanensis]|jgi:molybdate transport system substrate-binding protein|uniref:molybdate ABC transporter substrate-binding protein n=1 Tax=Pollutimonas bauzanensis TaxID=658167 RepID=UPI00333FECB8
MKIKRFVATALFAMLGWNASASAEDIVVSAAASLTNAFTELAVKFQQTHPDTKVLMSFAASDVLVQQIVNGAPTDIFASADQKAMDKAVEAKVIDVASRKDFVRNEVVFIVPADNPLKIQSLADLKSDSVKRVAFGNPATVPVGRYTKATLEHSGDWDAVKQREVLGQNVRQVLDYVARGEVDAGFVFATDAAIMPEKVKVIEKLPSPEPVLYPIALVQRKGRHAQAADFLAYIHSPEGQAVLAKFGFAKP